MEPLCERKIGLENWIVPVDKSGGEMVVFDCAVSGGSKNRELRNRDSTVYIYLESYSTYVNFCDLSHYLMAFLGWLIEIIL